LYSYQSVSAAGRGYGELLSCADWWHCFSSTEKQWIAEARRRSLLVDGRISYCVAAMTPYLSHLYGRVSMYSYTYTYASRYAWM
jgi:hypothetical protein